VLPCFTRQAVLFLRVRHLRQHCNGSVALIALVSIVAFAGCGTGRVDKNSDAYSDGEACGRIYALTHNEKTMEPCGVKKLDSAGTAVLVVMAGAVQTARLADLSAVPASLRFRSFARLPRR
jgi:hypothetical protein